MDDGAANATKKRRDRAGPTQTKFRPKDYYTIIDWLEEPRNLDSIIGAEKTKVGARYPTKKQAFQSLATYVNEHQLLGSTLTKVNGDGVRNRFIWLQDKYKLTQKAIAGTGWGLDDTDRRKGILTITAKIEHLCPGFERLHALFGTSPSIQTRENTYISGISGEIAEHMPEPATHESCGDYLDPIDEEEILDIPIVASNVNVCIPIPHEEVGYDEGSPVGSTVHHSPIPVQLDFPSVEQAPVSPLPPSVPIEDSGHPDPSPPLSNTPSNGSGAGPSKDNVTKTSRPSKKANVGKGNSISNAFASGLQSIYESKTKSIELKDRVQDRYFQHMEADRVLQVEKLKVQEKHMDADRVLEVEKLKVKEKRIAADALATRALFIERIINSNSHRSAAEITDLLKMIPSDP